MTETERERMRCEKLVQLLRGPHHYSFLLACIRDGFDPAKIEAKQREGAERAAAAIEDLM